MAYLGRPGATAPLTSADIPDNSITAAKIVDATIAAGDLANDVVISTSGAITTTGAFTSVGIDDNADANAITIDANEKVGIGTDGTLAMGGDIPLLQVGGTTNATGQVGIMRSNAGVQGGILTLAHTRDALGTYSTVLSDDDTTGQIRFAGSDGTDAVSFTASIISSVDGTPGANDMPGRLVFATSADGSQDPTERMRIDSSGNVVTNHFTFRDISSAKTIEASSSFNIAGNTNVGFNWGSSGPILALIVNTTANYGGIVWCSYRQEVPSKLAGDSEFHVGDGTPNGNRVFIDSISNGSTLYIYNTYNAQHAFRATFWHI